MGSYFSTKSQLDTGFREVDNSDVLGNEGRKALDACVKVKIYGKLETRRYDRRTAVERLRGCFCPKQPTGLGKWLSFDELALPADRDGDPFDYAKTYTINDIHDALDKLDDIPFVEKYPKKETGSEETRVSIDERRDAVERELEEARANLHGRRRYSFAVAQRRVRDCYANNLAGNDATIVPYARSFNIKDIYNTVNFHDKDSLETSSVPNGHVYEKICANRASIEREYENAVTSETPHKYNGVDAEQRLKSCYCDTDVLFLKRYARFTGEFDILRLRQQLHCDDKRIQLHKYPAKGPGSETLRKSIDEHRAKLKEEYETYSASCENRQKPHEYSRSEAEHRVRDCFAGTFPKDDDMFPLKEDDSGMPRIYQMFDIFDIKQSIDYFDDKKLLEKYPEEGASSEELEIKKKKLELKKRVDEHRNSINEEYKEADATNEIEHGSGFIIQDHFVLTNKHVIDTYLGAEDKFDIFISNANIDDLPCKVLHCDPGKDVALLYCKKLDLQQSCIFPLQLSVQPLLPGMQIFSFGYPMSHTDETALFVTGNVSGSKKTLSGHSLTVLNCSLNHGNSGGPVLTWVDDQVTVVGIATQKHIKDILTPKESLTIEKIKKSLQTHTISDVPDHYLEGRYTWSKIPEPCQVSIHLLTLKLYDALATHSSFNLSNALPGKLVVEFIKDAITECDKEQKKEQKKELNKILETLR